MTRRVRVFSAVAFGCALAVLPGKSVVSAADDTPATTSPSPDKPPDFSKYLYVNDVVGEIVKATDTSLTLRVTWFVPQVQGGGNNRRPPLHNSGHNYRNPFAANHNRPPKITVKEQHHDYVVNFVPESMVRTKVLPPKTDDTGKKVNYTSKELQDLKGKWAIPGYSASPADLVPGTIVEVIMIRDKTIPQAKLTEADLRVKFAVILGKDPNPPKDIANGGSNPPKKKN